MTATADRFKSRARIAAKIGFQASGGDPTDLACSNCGAAYKLNVPRVTRAFPSGKVSETADLCWICARLKNSVAIENEY